MFDRGALIYLKYLRDFPLNISLQRQTRELTYSHKNPLIFFCPVFPRVQSIFSRNTVIEHALEGPKRIPTVIFLKHHPPQSIQGGETGKNLDSCAEKISQIADADPGH